MKIGLFGGSFNPVHEGHIRLVKCAIEKLHLDEVIFIPCFKSTDKEGSIYESSTHRINMLLIVLPQKCSISTFEVSKKRAVESIETIRHFRSTLKEAELFFLIGEDNLETIDTWEDYKQIPQLVNLVVFRRKSKKEPLDKKGLKVTVMDNELWNGSSTEIRSERKLESMDIRVEVYVRENKLYGFAG